MIMLRTLSQEIYFQFFDCIFQKKNRRLEANQQQLFELIAGQHVPPLIVKDCTAQGDKLLSLFCLQLQGHRWVMGTAAKRYFATDELKGKKCLVFAAKMTTFIAHLRLVMTSVLKVGVKQAPSHHS